MILGMSIAAFTTLHVVISLIGIATGFIVAFGMISARRLPAMNAVFLATTALTSLTGFLFPFKGVTPGIVIGILSILILIVAVVALYSKRLSGGWRGTYVITVMLAQYFNFFVLIVQSFEKVPCSMRLAPDGVRRCRSRSRSFWQLLLFAVVFTPPRLQAEFRVRAGSWRDSGR